MSYFERNESIRDSPATAQGPWSETVAVVGCTAVLCAELTLLWLPG